MTVSLFPCCGHELWAGCCCQRVYGNQQSKTCPCHCDLVPLSPDGDLLPTVSGDHGKALLLSLGKARVAEAGACIHPCGSR